MEKQQSRQQGQLTRASLAARKAADAAARAAAAAMVIAPLWPVQTLEHQASLCQYKTRAVVDNFADHIAQCAVGNGPPSMLAGQICIRCRQDQPTTSNRTAA